jgi:GT2 family glycosyltransferase
MAERPIVSAIVVSHGTRELTLRAVRSLLEFLPEPSDVWVVDNGSADGTPAAIREQYPTVNLIELSENLGFGRANNVALQRARGRFLLLLNSDARLVDRTMIDKLLSWMQREADLGVVGPRLEDADGRTEHSARSFPSLAREIVRRWGLYVVVPRAVVGRWLLGDFWAPSEPVRVDWITGACMAVRREVYEQVGGFDERIFMYGEEMEWALRVAGAGWGVLYDPTVSVVHERAASGGPGPWRIRAALEADVRIIRWTQGRVRALGFTIVRLVGFLLEGIAMTAGGRFGRSTYRRERADHAWQSFRQQLRVAAHRPCG